MAEHDKEQEQEQEQEEKRKGNSESSHNSSELNEGDGEGVTGGGFFVREQDRLLPIANVGRIMRSRLPGNAKISKEAKQTMQECVSEFISFVTGEASDRCHKEKRKTINGDDILWAMSTLGFDDYAEPLKIYLQRFRLHEADKFYSATATSSCLAAAAVSAPPASASNNNNNTSSSILLHSHNHNLHLHLHHHHHSFSSSSTSSSSSSPLFSGPNHRPQNHHQQR